MGVPCGDFPSKLLLFSCDSSSIPRFVTDGLTVQSYTTKGKPHIETWGLHKDIKDINDNDNNDDDDNNNNKDDNDNNKDHNAMTRVTQLWDLIEVRGFGEDIKDISNCDDDDDDDDNNDNDEKKKNNNNEVEGISALSLHRDLGFSQGYQEHQGLYQ